MLQGGSQRTEEVGAGRSEVAGKSLGVREVGRVGGDLAAALEGDRETFDLESLSCWKHVLNMLC